MKTNIHLHYGHVFFSQLFNSFFKNDKKTVHFKDKISIKTKPFSSKNKHVVLAKVDNVQVKEKGKQLHWRECIDLKNYKVSLITQFCDNIDQNVKLQSISKIQFLILWSFV